MLIIEADRLQLKDTLDTKKCTQSDIGDLHCTSQHVPWHLSPVVGTMYSKYRQATLHQCAIRVVCNAV